jgi:uncharacterized LabA/DUF88 family protein
MTISLDTKNQATSQLTTSVEALPKSANLANLAGIAIAIISIFSGNKIFEKVTPFLFIGILINKSSQVDKRIQKAELDWRSLESGFSQSSIELRRLDTLATEHSSNLEFLESQQSKIKDREKQILDRQDFLESEVFQNRDNLENLLSQTRKVAYAQEEISARFDSIDEKGASQFQQIASKIDAVEAQLPNYLPKHHLAPYKDKLSRLQRQYLEGKLLNPERVLQLEQLQQQIETLSTAIEALSQKNSQQLKLPTTENCRILPKKQPERPKSDRVCAFIDGENISISSDKIWKCYPAWGKLLEYVRGQSQVCEARYYGSSNSNKQGFLDSLKRLGYQVISKKEIKREDGSAKGNLDIELASDMQACVDLYDTFVLVSCDGDFLDTVKKLRSVGKRVEVFSFFGRTHEPLSCCADYYKDLTPLKDRIGWDS